MSSQNEIHPVLNVSRRELLQTSGIGLGALALSGLLAENGNVAEQPPNRREKSVSPLIAAAPHHQPKAKRIIHLFMNGGPSQFDTFYPKPEVQKLDGKPLPESISDQLQPTQRKTCWCSVWFSVQISEIWRMRTAGQRVVSECRAARRRSLHHSIHAG